MVDDTPLPLSTVPSSKPTLSIHIAPSTSSNVLASRLSLLHTNSQTSPTSLYSSCELPISLQIKKRVETRVDSPLYALALLADVCSSSNIRWDDDRQLHYMEGDASQLGKIPQSTPLVLDQPQMNDTVSIGALTSAQKKSDAHAVRPSSLCNDVNASCDKLQEKVISNWKEGDGSSSLVRTPPMLSLDFTPSSPTAFSHSSPVSGSSSGYSSTSERSMTLAISSPDLPSLKKVPHNSPEILSQFIFTSPVFSENALDSSILGTPPLGIKDKAIALSQENIPSYDVNEIPRSPERCARSSLPPLPSHLELSPLSSLASSPLTEAFEEEPLSAISSHFTIASSVLSSRSPSPSLDSMVIDTSTISWEKVRRASTNAITNCSQQSSKARNLDIFQRSDTAPPEHTPRKRRRRSSPSSTTRAPFRYSKATLSSSRPNVTSKGVKSMETDISSVENFRPPVQSKSIAASKPKKEGRRGRKVKDSLENVPEVGTLSGMPLAELTELPMTGFMVETLALSRASAMAAPELLRAVLRSQPHLKEERSEGVWLAIVRYLLEKVKMFGKIERKGTDAADRPLEDQWFYIPENDGEQGRAELLKGLMPNKRTVTKLSKQYYFEPVSKLSRWDPEED